MTARTCASSFRTSSGRALRYSAAGVASLFTRRVYAARRGSRKKPLQSTSGSAEEEGFEPTVAFRLRRFSKPVP